MTVYVLTRRCYDDCDIKGVTASLDKAKEFEAAEPDTNGYEEFELFS